MSRETLLASLEAVADEGAVQFDDDAYIDFSVKHGDDGRCFEAGDDEGGCVQLRLSRADLVRLHAALTRTLLLDAR